MHAQLRMLSVVSSFAMLLAAGCGYNGPTLAGGKPVTFWVESLSNPDASIRRKAVDKLGNVGAADPQAFPAVVAALRDADPSVRRAAVRAIPKFGPRAGDAVGILNETQSGDTDPEVREAAAKVLDGLSSGTR